MFHSKGRTRLTVDKYDAREDILKFMVAKDKIITSLHDVKYQSIEKMVRSSQEFNHENGKIFKEPALVKENNIEINNSTGIMDPELISMFHQRENILQNSPGNFDIVSTHHDIKYENSLIKQASNTTDHFYFPKKNEFHSFRHNRTRGTLSGAKVNHPCYKNASRRYQSRSKAPNSIKIEYTKRNGNNSLNNSDATLEKAFKDNFLNFIDPKSEKDMYIFSNPVSIKTQNSTFTRDFRNKILKKKGKRPGTMEKFPSSPINLQKRYHRQSKIIKRPHQPNLTPHGSFRNKRIKAKPLMKITKKEEEGINNIPQHLFNFMSHASKELLKTNSDLNSKEQEQGNF